MSFAPGRHDEHAPITYQQSARFLNSVTTRMREAETEMKTAGDLCDNAERDLTIAEQKAWAEVDGRSAEERKANVKAEVADLAFDFAQAKRRVKIAEKAMARLEREASITTFLGKWAQSERGSVT